MRYLLQQLLEQSASAYPDQVSVVDGKRTLTYRELDARSNQLARLLCACGVQRGDRVALYLDKSAESIVGLYAVLKTGAAYVPFDPQAPIARLAYIAGNCGIRSLISGVEKEQAWSALRQSGAPIETVIVANGVASEDAASHEGYTVVGNDAIDGESDAPLAVGALSLDLAYILYTSGSTGNPKGVMLTHRNALAFVEWAIAEFGVTPGDRLSSHAPLHFDLSIFDIFAAAGSGATLVLVPSRVALFPAEVTRFIAANQITVWYSVPSVLSRLTEQARLEPGSLPSLRTVLFAGEVFPTKFLRRLMSLLPQARFCNLYGPTETNVCTWYDVPPISEDQVEPIPIGRAIADDEVFAVTDDGRRAATGEVGELCVRGSTVMQGYWGDPERTARTLVPNPLGGNTTDLVYRTGDLVAEDSDGNYRFFGRRDSQIKSRGYRIELGEIESALYASPNVEECAVLAVPDPIVTNRLLAVVVVNNGAGSGDLIKACAERVPNYMIPERFEFREVLPKTSTGKVDRQTLMRELSEDSSPAAVTSGR